MIITYMEGADCYIAIGREVKTGIIYKGVAKDRIEAITRALNYYRQILKGI